MDYNTKKMRILEMVEKNIISAEEGLTLLKKLEEEIRLEEGSLLVPVVENDVEEKKDPPKKKNWLSWMMDDEDDEEDEEDDDEDEDDEEDEEDEEDDDEDKDDEDEDLVINSGKGKKIHISSDGIHILANGKKIVAGDGNLEIVTRGGKKSIKIGSKGSKKNHIAQAMKFVSNLGVKSILNAVDTRRFVVRVTTKGKVTTSISLPLSMAIPFLKAGFKVAKVSGKEGESFQFMEGDDFVTYVSDNAKDMEYLKEVNMKVVEEFLKNNETGTIVDVYQEKDDVHVYVGIE